MIPAVRAVCVAFVCAVLPLAGCARGDRHLAPGTARIGMVTDVGGLGDRSFNDSAYRGLVQARDQLGVEVQVLQSRSTADYDPNLTVLANKEYDEIIAVGFLMAKDVAAVAERQTQRHFAIIDAVVDEPNVASVTFKEEQGSFLAGALAAMVSRTHTIAFLGGVDIPLLRKFEAGFAAGARQIDPSTRVLVKYAGSFDDVAAGKELAGVLFDQSADIVYAAAGKAGLGAIDAVRRRNGRFVIGVDSDQDAIAPGKILTSMIKRVDVGVYRLAQAIAAHHAPSGHVELGVREHAIGLSDFVYTRAQVTPQRRRILDRLTSAIVAGKIVPPATREELQRYTPIALPS